jgi:hypothetical protein
MTLRGSALFRRTGETADARHLYDLAAVVLPAVSFVEFTIVGRLALTEILFVLALPWLSMIPDRRRVPTWFLILWSGWLVAQILTDVVVGSAPRDLLRGWAGIAFTLTNFVALYLLAGSERRVRLLAVGFALGGYLGFLLAPVPQATADPWKWGLAHPSALLLVAVLAGTAGARFKWVSVGVIALLGVSNLVLGYRSMAGVSLLTAAYLAVGHLTRRGGESRLTPRRAVTAFGLLVAGGILVLAGYSLAASSGVLGPQAELTYSRQGGALGVLFGGRPEALVSSEAIVDSPLLGHGSWAKDPTYAEMLVERQLELGYAVTPQYVDADLIPAHSYLLGAWVWAGVLGAAFWAGVAAVSVWLLARMYFTIMRLAPLLVFVSLLLLWDVAFSPYGFGARLTATYYLAAVLLGHHVLTRARSPVR